MFYESSSLEILNILVTIFLMKISLYPSRVTKRNNLRLNTWGDWTWDWAGLGDTSIETVYTRQA